LAVSVKNWLMVQELQFLNQLNIYMSETQSQPNVNAGAEGRAIPPGQQPQNSVQGQNTTDGVQAGSQSTPTVQPPTGNPQQPASAVIQNAGILVPNLFNTIGPPPIATENLNDAGGRRVRLRPKPAALQQTYGSSGLLLPLVSTNGMLWPYQPNITYQQDVNYQTMEVVHANQDFHVYARTPALKLQVEGEFTAQNQQEGRYALACIHFLRTVSKMYFGGQTTGASQNMGTPPPVLLFDAYGQYMFNALPVIVTSFTVTLPKDVDYVPINIGDVTSTNNPASNAAAPFDSINEPYLKSDTSGIAWIPAVFSITTNLVVQNTPSRLKAFDLDQFRTGALMKQGTWV
jgi:hypothetical protein